MNKPAELELDTVPVWIDGKPVATASRFGNVFNPAYTVVCRVAKTWLRKPVSDLGWLG